MDAGISIKRTVFIMPRVNQVCKPKKCTPIYIAGKARAVGNVTGDTFHKNITGRKHLLRKPPAIAFDTSTLHDAEQAGAAFVVVTDTDTGKQYRASIKAIFRHGTPFNRGFGDQIYLPLGWWKRPDAPEQVSLFSEVAA